MANGRDLSAPESPKVPLSLEALPIPPDVRIALVELGESLVRAGGDNIVALALHGDLVKGRFRAGKSEVGLVLVLRDAAAPALVPLSPVLRVAQRAMRVEATILAESEIGTACDVFATRFLDIQRRHVLLAGRDVFAGLSFTREHFRLRIEHELREITLRLRRRWVVAHDEREALAARLVQTMPTLANELGSLLVLAGKGAESDDSRAIVVAAARAFDLDEAALTRALTLKLSERPGEDVQTLYARVLASVARAASVVDGMGAS